MKVKTSITLSGELLQAVDRFLGKNGNRSHLIERAVREFLLARERQLQEARDREILNREASRLNREAADVLTYQVDL